MGRSEDLSFPAKQLRDTWNRESTQKDLVKHREVIRERLKIYQPNDRAKVVIGVRLGTGYGKTHILTEAPELLGRVKGVYVTYNLGQTLTVDRAMPVKCVFFQMILALLGCKAFKCYKFLTENEALVRAAKEDNLRQLFVLHIGTLVGGGEIVISVDEIMELGLDPAKDVVSALARTAAEYMKRWKSMCTVLVSSLATKVFATKSNWTPIDWAPSRPNQDTLSYFAEELGIALDKQEAAMALANAVCGRHMRSIVTAFPLIAQDMRVSVKYLFDQVSDNIETKVEDSERRIIRNYVRECISTGTSDWSNIEDLMAALEVVPPVFLWLAFQDQDSNTKGCLYQLQHAFSLCDGGAGKHLENVTKWYDLCGPRTSYRP